MSFANRIYNHIKIVGRTLYIRNGAQKENKFDRHSLQYFNVNKCLFLAD